MNGQARRKMQEIQLKVKSPITGHNEFESSSAVIEYAINQLYDNLKRNKVL